MNDSMQVFDRVLVRKRRERAAKTLPEADFLLRESAGRLADRLLDVARTFTLALDLGCHTGQLAAPIKLSKKVETLFQADFSPAMATAANKSSLIPTFCADEEFLPIKNGGLDLILSNLSLHWVNDLPGALAQICRSLKPDGLFLATIFGGETLKELRTVLMESEEETIGGIAPRVSPFIDVRDSGNLLSRAGFSLPVVDTENIEVTYENIFKLMADLRAMAETNAILQRSRIPIRRSTLMRAAELYQEKFSDHRGRIIATFQIVNLTAWSPHESQQKPMRPGTAKTTLAEALSTEEIILNDKTPFSKKITTT
ncbi:MAG: SAM-dependent methyltransferase [Candidatus Marinimicrobia bacterium]|nr:SAM-dependent methyltransferase [Candidatus Neomarinimicrobiota bacterium]